MSIVHRYCFGEIAGAIVSSVPLGVVAKAVPSVQSVTLHEDLFDMGNVEGWLRFCFVVPLIQPEPGKASYENAAEAIDHLCAEVVIPYAAKYDLKSDLVVVSMVGQIAELVKTCLDADFFLKQFASRMKFGIRETF